jgi:Zn-dependent protease
MADRITWLPPGAPTAPEPSAGPPPRPPSLPGMPPEPSFADRLKRRLGPIAVILIAIVKYGKAGLLLLPKLKLLTTSGSMLVSIAAYSLLWGWRFAVGFVLLLLVHEMGHVIQLRREGIPASAPLFIPFLGAVVGAKSLGDDAAAEARVGLAGPVLGTAGTIALLGVAEGTDSELLKALAFTGFFLNLFNLVPLTPLDGGRAMAALTPWMWFAGLFVAAGIAFAFPNPIIILIVLLGAYDTYRRWKALKNGGDAARTYYRVRPRTRAIIGLVYLALIVVCVLGMHVSHVERTFADV